MIVTPLTKKGEVSAAFKALRARLTSGTVALRRTLGFPGGQVEGLVHWRPSEQIWVHFNATDIPNRYWCCYGVQDPTVEDYLDIAVEINPPREGFDRRIAGAFVVTPEGRVSLSHSGKIGGGRKGVGKEAFSGFYLGPTYATVSWPDGRASQVILIAGMADRHLSQQVASFVHEVARFKKAVASGSLPRGRTAAKQTFTPEFEGKKSFHVNQTVTSVCDHGTVVRALRNALDALGIRTANDRARDLYITNRHGDMKVLFEVKTALEPLDLYSGVGQLMIHCAQQDQPPRRVLVLPRSVGKAARRALAQLDIPVLEYTWKAERPAFDGLRGLIGRE